MRTFINFLAIPLTGLWLLWDLVRLVLGFLLALFPFFMGLIWGCMMTGFDAGFDLTYIRRR